MKNGQHSGKAQIALRKKKELEMLAQQMTQTEIAKQLGISRVTLWKDLLDINKRFDTDLPEDFKKALRAQIDKIKELIAVGRIADGRKIELLQRNVELEAKFGPKIEMNNDATHQTLTVVYVDDEDVRRRREMERLEQLRKELGVGQPPTGDGVRQLEAAKAEGERQYGVNDALTVDPSRILEGEVKYE